jgi:enoyl-CoA hydratase
MADILHETRGAVAWTTLNRPQSRNAMTFAMYEGLFEQAKRVGEDPAIRAWVITGAGGKAFAAGTDISQFLDFKTGQDALDYEASSRRSRIARSRSSPPSPAPAPAAASASRASAICASRRRMRASACPSPAPWAIACRWRTTPASPP